MLGIQQRLRQTRLSGRQKTNKLWEGDNVTECKCVEGSGQTLLRRARGTALSLELNQNKQIATQIYRERVFQKETAACTKALRQG